MLTSIFLAVFCGFVVSNAEGRFVLPAVTTQIDVNVNEPNITGCTALAVTMEQCFLAGSGLPDICNSKKSTTVTCAENAYNKYYKACPYKLITRFADSYLKNLKSSDQVLCTNKLYEKFEENMWCWALIKNLAFSFLSITKGFLTKDGCGAVKLNIDIMKAAYPGVCADLTDTYLTSLYKKTACG